MPAQPSNGRWSGLLLSQLLAVLSFAGCAWWVHRKVAHILPLDRVTLSVIRLTVSLDTEAP